MKELTAFELYFADLLVHRESVQLHIARQGQTQPKATYKNLIINSRTAIDGAIIGRLLVFYNSKNLNCIGALSFF